MDHPSSFDNVADQRFQEAPFADERSRYLHHCTTHGAKPVTLKAKRCELLWIARTSWSGCPPRRRHEGVVADCAGAAEPSWVR